MSDPEIKITVTRSGGSDGAVLVFIDTTFEPNASDGGPGLRVDLNDWTILNESGRDDEKDSQAARGGVDYVNDDGASREATEHTFTLTLNELKYLEQS